MQNKAPNWEARAITPLPKAQIKHSDRLVLAIWQIHREISLLMPTQLIIHERLDDVAGVCSSLTDVGLVLLFHRDQKNTVMRVSISSHSWWEPDTGDFENKSLSSLYFSKTFIWQQAAPHRELDITCFLPAAYVWTLKGRWWVTIM